MALPAGRIKPGDKAVITGSGGGLTWGSALIQLLAVPPKRTVALSPPRGVPWLCPPLLDMY